MSNRRRPRASRHLLGDITAAKDHFSAMARTTCDQCGAAVRWVSADQAGAHGLDVDAAARFHGDADLAGLDIWVCTQCDNAGVFGAAEF